MAAFDSKNGYGIKSNMTRSMALVYTHTHTHTHTYIHTHTHTHACTRVCTCVCACVCVCVRVWACVSGEWSLSLLLEIYWKQNTKWDRLCAAFQERYWIPFEGFFPVCFHLFPSVSPPTPTIPTPPPRMILNFPSSASLSLSLSLCPLKSQLLFKGKP